MGLAEIIPSFIKVPLRALLGPALPRIGRLRQHSPRPLQVPAPYVSSPPSPAPSISIVTPSYQQARFLARAIQSVVSQEYPALEYVVQDGASTDGSAEILDRFGGVLASWASEPDAGQADAINRGFRRTSGEIMAWLNSDDLLLPGSLAFVARYFEDHPEVDVLYGDRVLIDEDDREIGIWILPEHDDTVLTLEDYVPQETLFWRRTVWEKAGAGVDPAFHYALDWDLLLRFREVGARIGHVPRLLGAFRVHPEQKTTAEEMRGREECSQLRRRVHGRDFSPSELRRLTAAYRRRHVLAHLRYRIRERMSRGDIALGLPLSPDTAGNGRG